MRMLSKFNTKFCGIKENKEELIRCERWNGSNTHFSLVGSRKEVQNKLDHDSNNSCYKQGTIPYKRNISCLFHQYGVHVLVNKHDDCN